MAAETTLVPNLGTKLVAVIRAVDAVEKRGRNTQQSYDYVKAADVAREVRKALVDQGIAFDYSVESSQRWEKITNSGGTLFFCELAITVTFTDTASGESKSVRGIGWGMDTGDKAPYKAMTGALKYALRMNFLIPDESDPENDSDNGNHGRPEVQRKSNGSGHIASHSEEEEPLFDENGEIVPVIQRKPQAEKPKFPIAKNIGVTGDAAISEGKAKRFWAIALGSGKSKDEIAQYLGSIGLEDIKNCPWKGKTYENAIQWAEAK